MITQSIEWNDPLDCLPKPGEHLLLYWSDWYGSGSNSQHTEIGILNEKLEWRTLYHPRKVPRPTLWTYLSYPTEVV